MLGSATLVSYSGSGVRTFSPRAVNLAYDPRDGFMYGTSVARFLKLNPSTLANAAPAGMVGGFFAAANTGRKFVTQSVDGQSHLIVSQWYGWPAGAAMPYGSGGSANLFRWESTESALQLGLGWQRGSGYGLAKVPDRMVAGDVTRDGVDDIAPGYDSGGQLRLDVWGGTTTTGDRRCGPRRP